MELMLDTNIILDHLGKRQPFYEMSRKVCLLGITKEAHTYISINALTDIFYILRKDYGSEKAQEMIRSNLSFLKPVSTSPEDLHYALSEKWKDFEDCLVAQCAKKIKADYLITRNVKDFTRSKVPALSPEELFILLESQGLSYEEFDY